MDPNRQQPHNDPYGFITNPQQLPQKSRGVGNSMLSRIIIVVGGVLLLLIIGSVVVSLMGRAGQAATNNLKGIYAEQQEIIRIAGLGSKDALSTDAKSFAATVSLSITSSQQKIKEELGDTKLSDQELAAKKNADTDKVLEGAKATNSYDEVLQDTLTNQLQSYMQTLQKVFNETDDEALKQVISSAFDSASAIVASTE